MDQVLDYVKQQPMHNLQLKHVHIIEIPLPVPRKKETDIKKPKKQIYNKEKIDIVMNERYNLISNYIEGIILSKIRHKNKYVEFIVDPRPYTFNNLDIDDNLYYSIICDEYIRDSYQTQIEKNEIILTPEQDIIYNQIKYFIINPNANYQSFILSGPAGSGKTTLLKKITNLDNVIVIYITMKRKLVSLVASSIQNVLCKTFTSFLMGLTGKTFYTYQKLCRIMRDCQFNNVEDDNFDNDIIEKLSQDYNKFLAKLIYDYYLIRQDNCNLSTVINCTNIILFVDEYSMINYNEYLLLFKCMRIFSDKTKTKVLLITAGDPNQLPPIHATINDNAIAIQCLHTDKYYLTRNVRCSNNEYNNVLNMIASNDKKWKSVVHNLAMKLNTNDELDITFNEKYYIRHIAIFHDFDYNLFATTCKHNITKRLPTFVGKHNIIMGNANNTIVNLEELIDAISFNKNERIFIAKSNISCIQINMSISIYLMNKINDYNIRYNDQLLPIVLVPYLFSFTNVVTKVTDLLKLHPLSRSCVILPIGNGIPYVMAETIGCLDAGSLIRILYYCLKREILWIVDNKNRIFILHPCLHQNVIFTYKQELFSDYVGITTYTENTKNMEYINLWVYNFPITPAFAINIYNSQGETYTNDVYIDLKNTTHNEAYVAMSRVKDVNQIKKIIF